MADKQKKASGTGPSAAATSNAAINSTIKSIRTTGKKLNELIQTGIVQVIMHANTFGDCTGAARLVDAIPQTARRNEVINHIADFSPIRITKDNKTGLMKASFRKPEDENYKPFNVDGVKANPWYERKSVTEREPGMPYSFGTAEKDIRNLADKLQSKAVAKNVVEQLANGEEKRRDNVVNDDRESLHATALLLRTVANDPSRAAELLGLPKDTIKQLQRGEEAYSAEIAKLDVQNEGTEGEEERLASLEQEQRTGTNG